MLLVTTSNLSFQSRPYHKVTYTITQQKQDPQTSRQAHRISAKPTTSYFLASLLFVAPLADTLGLLPEKNDEYKPTSAYITQNNELYVRSANGDSQQFVCSGQEDLECILQDEATISDPRIPQLARTTKDNSRATLYSSVTNYSLPLTRQ